MGTSISSIDTSNPSTKYCKKCSRLCIFDVSKLSPNQDFKKAPLSDSKLSLLTKKNVKNYLNSRKKSQKDLANNKKERSKKSVRIFMTQSLDNKNKPDMEYPRSIFLIIATEFCERFSFCGLRTILSLYLRNILLFHENKATVVYHVFIMMCYFVPVIGAILADSCLGRFRTILYFSVIYTVGNIVMCFAATPPIGLEPVTFTMIGLSLIATGTGGIKPCVAAFGGDQFKVPQQEHLLKQFFAIFYFTINFGGFVGMILTPILRKAITCFGDDTCYSLGFGFPAALMIISLGLFIAGKPLYRIKFPKQNIMVRFTTCMMYAICTKIRTKEKDPNRHWLSYAEKKFDAKLISDMKNVLAILYLFFPLPIFWSLFDQQGSRWTFQASRMNGEVFGYQIMPDQIQVINPALVLLLIPLFNKGIYPCLGSCHVLVSPLQRMVAGGFIAGLAFICSGVLEYELEQTYPMLPSKGEAFINFVNSLPCDLMITDSKGNSRTLSMGDMTTIKKIPVFNKTEYNVVLSAMDNCKNTPMNSRHMEIAVPVTEREVRTVLIGIENKKIECYLSDLEDLKKTLSGKPKLRLSVLRSSDKPFEKVTITIKNNVGFSDIYFVPEVAIGVSAYLELLPGQYGFSVFYPESQRTEFEGGLNLELGGVYSLVMREYNRNIVFAKLYAMTPPNTIHMFWIIPQYVFLSIAEVMFAISGLEFSFTQAPKSMKTVTMAAWYFSVACGNLLVIIITQAQFFSNQADEFFLFAALIFVDMFIFAWMSLDYQTVSIESDDSSLTFPEPDENYPLLALTSHEAVLP
ncbi:Oligopeptide transporter, putative [Pediculus humanus corporis]|uniref:Oligopeptide transporter 1 n=1 Tax=Pediculus humanus subsp. corporis TaxID=121224 RepID=E0VT65_PEDHC|nr:Oligopeptide transporter, putative [Pediculus humanus corporis]EEB16571.1 Oligopeptide transporter, putative [Pediculus humanus corporis]